jgi:hypothetical protein
MNAFCCRLQSQAQRSARGRAATLLSTCYLHHMSHEMMQQLHTPLLACFSSDFVYLFYLFASVFLFHPPSPWLLYSSSSLSLHVVAL